MNLRTPRRTGMLLLLLPLLAACGQGQQASAPATVPSASEPALTSPPAPAPAATGVPTPQPATPAAPASPPAPTPAATGVPAPQPATPALPTSFWGAAPDRPGGALTLQLELVAGDLDQPLYLTHAGDGSGRIFVVEKAGVVRILRDSQVLPDPFLDITDRVGARGSEQGLLSVAFHPGFGENGRLFVNYTNQNGDTVISEFRAAGNQADPQSERVLLTIDQPYANHNGGLVTFGLDGMLYIGMGDGGSAGDPLNAGQDRTSLLGKLLRIDVDQGEPYAIPAGNPYADGREGRAEIWASGVRNPWRFSFDRTSGDLYLADVGQNAIEEVHYTPAGTPGGVNYGWRPVEGDRCFEPGCDLAAFTAPVVIYDHSLGCSITGGYVYRGTASPALQGFYLFGDYCSGRLWAVRPAPSGSSEWLAIQTQAAIASFGEDEAGEVYITDLRGGAVYRITVP